MPHVFVGQKSTFSGKISFANNVMPTFFANVDATGATLVLNYTYNGYLSINSRIKNLENLEVNIKNGSTVFLNGIITLLNGYITITAETGSHFRTTYRNNASVGLQAGKKLTMPDITLGNVYFYLATNDDFGGIGNINFNHKNAYLYLKHFSANGIWNISADSLTGDVLTNIGSKISNTAGNSRVFLYSLKSLTQAGGTINIRGDFSASHIDNLPFLYFASNVNLTGDTTLSIYNLYHFNIQGEDSSYYSLNIIANKSNGVLDLGYYCHGTTKVKLKELNITIGTGVKFGTIIAIIDGDINITGGKGSELHNSWVYSNSIKSLKGSVNIDKNVTVDVNYGYFSFGAAKNLNIQGVFNDNNMGWTTFEHYSNDGIWNLAPSFVSGLNIVNKRARIYLKSYTFSGANGYLSFKGEYDFSKWPLIIVPLKATYVGNVTYVGNHKPEFYSGINYTN